MIRLGRGFLRIIINVIRWKLTVNLRKIRAGKTSDLREYK